MTIAKLKADLHNAINAIHDEEKLKILVGVVQSYLPSDDLVEEQKRVLDGRHEKYLRGEMKTISLEELRKHVRDKYDF